MRGYPDFLALPAYSGFGYLYREYDNWRTVAAGATETAISIAGQGIIDGGYIQLDMANESNLLLTPFFIVDGTSVQLPVFSALDLFQSFGECDLPIRPCYKDYASGHAEGYYTFIPGTSWGFSFVLQYSNAAAFDIDVDTLLYYRKVERP